MFFRLLSVWFVKYRRGLAFAVAAATLAALAGVARLEYDDVPRAVFRSDDADFARLEEAFTQFGADDSDCVFLVEADDLFTPARVVALQRFIGEVERLQGIEHVRSLRDLVAFPKRGGTAVLTKLLQPIPTDPYPLLPEISVDGPPPSPEACEEIRRQTLAHPLAAGQIVSDDGRATLVVARLAGDNQAVKDVAPTIARMQALADRTARDGDLRVRLTGLAPIRTDIFESVRKESAKFVLIGGTLAVVMATLMFRRPAAVAIVCLSSLLGALWTVGLMGLVGEKMNIITTVLPTLVLVIGFADAVHLMIDIRRERSAGATPLAAASKALRHLGLACVLCAVTTAVGFGSLALAKIEIIQRFGIIVGIGAVLALVAVLTAVPLLASTRLGRHVQSPAKFDLPERLSRAFEPATNWIVEHSRLVTAAAIVVTGAMGVSMAFLVPSNQATEALPTSRPSFQAIVELDRNFGGSSSAMVLVDWNADLRHDSPEVLHAVDSAQQLAAAHSDVRNPVSIVNLIRSLPGEGRSLAKQAKSLRWVPDDALRYYARPDLHRAVIRLRLQNVGSNEHNQTFDDLRAGLASLEQTHPGIKFHLTGTSVLASRNLNQMIVDLAMSLGSAAAIILVVMALGFRSLRLGLVSIVPNVFPMVVTSTVLVLSGQPLQMTSVIVFSICLGIAVNDTIHFINRFQRELETDGDVRAAILRSYRGVGAAMITTSLVLLAGFGSLQVSEMPTTRLFSALSCLTIVAALVGDLAILPAMLRAFVPSPRGKLAVPARNAEAAAEAETATLAAA